MRILFIRHADPDYKYDALTEKGQKEAEYLAEYLAQREITQICSSPLGRAYLTAKAVADKTNQQITICEWLKELSGNVDVNMDPELLKAFPDSHYNEEEKRYDRHIPWDAVPSYLERHPELLDAQKWKESDIALHSNVLPIYDYKIREFDHFLKERGYERMNLFYKVNQPNKDTYVLFCHLGAMCLLLSHIVNSSPYVLWNSFCSAPSGITELVSEEREEGVALFRILKAGDISHLSLKEEPPAFSARFAECYTDNDRH